MAEIESKRARKQIQTLAIIARVNVSAGIGPAIEESLIEILDNPIFTQLSIEDLASAARIGLEDALSAITEEKIQAFLSAMGKRSS